LGFHIETAASNFCRRPSYPAPTAIADFLVQPNWKRFRYCHWGLENTQAISLESNQYSNKTAG